MILPVNYNHLTSTGRRNVREEYMRRQDGKCMYCNTTLKKGPVTRNKKINLSLFPGAFFKYHVHLHHDHDTGMTEGAVHSYCNAVLWQYEGK